MAHLHGGNSATLRDGSDPARPSTTADRPRSGRTRVGAGWGDLALYAVITALILGAWQFTERGYFKAGDDIGYGLGVAGGVMMLLLFSYPLRKHVRALHRLGQVKWWFLVHMVLGIGGPLLILLHSTFRIGSVNAAVALYSMLIVAGSGVAGRFLYVRINRGLQGEKATLRELQARAGLDRSEARSRLAFAPAVEARLLAFESLVPTEGAMPLWRSVLWLPLHRWQVYRQCWRALQAPLNVIASQRDWSAQERRSRERQALRLVQRVLGGVVRVARLQAYERLFALWHVAHVPFVYLMVLSAVAHVVAVHAY